MMLTDSLNDLLKSIEIQSEQLRFLIYLGILIILGFLAGSIIQFIILKILEGYNKRKTSPAITYLIKYMTRPMRVFIPLLLISLFLPALSTFSYYPAGEKTISTLFYISFTWVVINLVYTLFDTLISNHNITIQDNLKERRLITQLQFLRRLFVIIIVVISVSLILLNFENVRKLGAGILTSAGILGIIIGFAAQKSIGNLLAGLQIAFTQPIRIDDVVVLENEFGNIEEITMTYVVVRLWDQRRLVVPLNYFIDKPFQNWTKTSADVLATVTIHVDYKMPVEELRTELNSILESNPLWNKKAKGLQVTDANNQTMELRALMSASNSGNAWDLRCYVREKLISFVRDKYPEYLPTSRSEVNITKTNLN